MAWDWTFNHYRRMDKKIDVIRQSAEVFYQNVHHRFDRVERLLNIIINDEGKIMSAQDDLKAKVVAATTEIDNIGTAVQALKDAQQAGNQAGIDAAVADISTAFDTLQTHMDAVQTLAGTTPPAQPTA